MRAAVVVPCLNEQATLEQTCTSLGFGQGAQHGPANDVALILVDNGSEDATWAIMERVRQNSPLGSVVLAKEMERGYVPPRHRGVLEARTLAQSSNRREGEFLVIQADADTIYCEGYLPNMMRAGDVSRGDCIIEAVSCAPPEFDAEYPQYRARCAWADDAVRQLCVGEADDIVVDDKTCAYTIENYFRWGGHRREFASNGDEVYAETTRLYIKAHLKGAYRVRADDAIAWPSRRKLTEDPALHFATAGFPRERSWRRHWDSSFRVRLDMQQFVDENADEAVSKAALIRRAHALILFGVLPAYVAKLTGSENCEGLVAEFSDLLPVLEPLSRADLLNNSAILFERGFSLMETHWPQLMERACTPRPDPWRP